MASLVSVGQSLCCVYRLGGGERDAAEVMEHPFYTGVDWQVVYDRKVQKNYQTFDCNVLSHERC